MYVTGHDRRFNGITRTKLSDICTVDGHSSAPLLDFSCNQRFVELLWNGDGTPVDLPVGDLICMLGGRAVDSFRSTPLDVSIGFNTCRSLSLLAIIRS